MNKSLKIFSLSILMLVVLTTLVSAVDFHPSELVGSAEQGQTATLTFTIENTHSDDLTEISMTKSDLISGSNTISSSNLQILNLPSTINEDENSSTVTLQIDIPSSQSVGTYEGQLELFGTLDVNDSRGTLNITLTVTESTDDEPEEIASCSLVSAGDLKIEIDDISVEGFGDDEEWLPLDEIEIDITLENKNDDYDIEDIEVSWGLYNRDTGEWYIDDEENDFDLKDGDEKTITVKFTLDDDLDELADDDYVFYVWANGVLDDDSDDGVDLCASDSQSIDMIIESDFVILNDIQFTPETVSCGTEVQITADVWNIGDDDQDDVYVTIYNKELGINKKVEIGDIDAFEDEKLDVTITLPGDAEEKRYNLILVVYDDNDDIYENDYDDEIAEFIVPLTIEAGSCSTAPTATITASLQSDANAGEELVVKAVIINTGSGTKTFTVSANDYAGWASLGSIDKTSVTIDEGESEEVLIKLNVNGDASGTKTFNIELTEGNRYISQPVSVSIEASSTSLPGITGLFSGFGGGNWYLWGIGALNVLLVLIIIVVAFRVARKKE